MKKLVLSLTLFASFIRAAELDKNISSVAIDAVEILNNGELSTEARFVFSGPFSFERNLADDMKLQIFFPNTKVGDFDKAKMVTQFYNSGLVQKVSLNAFNSGVMFSIKFHDNKALVRLNKIKDSNRLVLEIYSKDMLNKIKDSIDGPLYLTQTGEMHSSSVVKKKVFA